MKHINLVTPIPGPKSQEILARRAATMPNGAAKSTEVVIESAKGALVKDVDGNTLLDFAGGIGVMNIGHGNSRVANAVKKQLDKFTHHCQIVSTSEPPIELAEMLHRLTPGDFPKKTLFGNSGSEAVENAVNIARYYTKRAGIICFEGGYHGRTYLTLSLTSKHGLFKKGFGAMASEIYRLPAPNMYRIPTGMNAKQYLEYMCNNLENALIAQVDPSCVAAMIIEPVIGEGGFIQIPKEFLQKMRDIADKHGIVLIFDEIQSGMGRTGKVFACEHFGIVPDIITTAKSLGAGFPIAATVGRAEIMDAPHLGGVGGTYTGNPIACVAAIEALKIISSPQFLNKTNKLGEQMRKTFDAWKKKYPLVGDARGVGAMRIVEFVKDKNTKEPDADLTLEIIKDAVAQGLLLIRAGLYSNCIRFLPPNVITKDQMAEGLEIIEGAIRRAHEKRGITIG
jgi:4-aminobutyrate aminotransferase / (S)-3-amino-2-methylpropionate transaminase / 5-aminovalerate transaminase